MHRRKAFLGFWVSVTILLTYFFRKKASGQSHISSDVSENGRNIVEGTHLDNENDFVQNDGFVFSYANYSTKPQNYQTWIDIIINRSKMPDSVVTAMIALLIYVIGFLLAYRIDFHLSYVRTIPVYLGVFGIFWVTRVIRYYSLKFHDAYEELRPCFLISDEEYTQRIQLWFSKFANHKGNFFISGLLFVIALLVVYLGFFVYPQFASLVDVYSLRPDWFIREGWFEPQHRLGKAAIVAFYGFAVALPLGTAARLIVLNYGFLHSLKKFPVIPLSNTIRIRLRKTTNIYIGIAFTWFIGVSLFGVLLFTDIDVFSIIGLVSLSSLGIITFLTPQIVYRQYLLRSADLSSRWILGALYRKLNGQLIERDVEFETISREYSSKLADMGDLAGFVEASAPQDFWVYSPSELLFLFIGQALAIGSVYFQDAVRLFITSLIG